MAEPVAGFVGQKLGAAVEPVMYPNPDAYLESFGKNEWDMAIGPRVLAPTDKADSTANLWAISLVYVAAPGTEFPDVASVDSAGVKIGTIRGAPSDRVLTREIKAAEIVRIPLSPTIAADASSCCVQARRLSLARTPASDIRPPKPCLAPKSCRALSVRFSWQRRCRKAAPQRLRRCWRQSLTKQNKAVRYRRRSRRRASRA